MLFAKSGANPITTFCLKNTISAAVVPEVVVAVVVLAVAAE